MSGLDPSGDTVISVVIVVMTVVLILVYLLNQLRLKKRDALRHESSQALPERAFNQIRLARAGADHLGRQGFDVSSVKSSLAEADEALAKGNAAVALRIADDAREKLVAIRERRAAVSGGAGNRAAASTIPVAAMVATVAVPVRKPGATSAMAPESGGETEVRPKLPAHQVEARFELNLLRDELGKARANAPGRNEAEELAVQAQAAYDGQQYSQSWQLALRGRRRLGASIEHVGSKNGAAALAASAAPAAKASLAAVGPDPPTVNPCPQCGKPVRASDRFCRACGTTVGAERCPRCGAPQEPGDQFCGVCGTPAAE